jgi:hypothetical protein
MDHKEMFLKHWVREGPVTRKVIGRIPQDGSNYRPDPKSRTAPEIAWLMVREEVVLGDSMEKGAVLPRIKLPKPCAERRRTRRKFLRRQQPVFRWLKTPWQEGRTALLELPSTPRPLGYKERRSRQKVPKFSRSGIPHRR